MVRITGFEPARLAVTDSKSVASANSAISAYEGRIIALMKLLFCYIKVGNSCTIFSINKRLSVYLQTLKLAAEVEILRLARAVRFFSIIRRIILSSKIFLVFS